MNIKLLYFFLLCSLASFAQQAKISTSIDTAKNKIGAQFTLTIKTTADTAAKVQFPAGKNFGPLEVIRNYPTDTIRKDAIYELVKKYGLTQFDSGSYMIPRLPVTINKKKFFTDSIRVEVANVKVDTLKQKLYDIKNIVPADSRLGEWWIWLLAILIIGAAMYLGYKWYKNRPAKNEAPVYKTPIEKATGLLKQLEQKELIRKGEVKAYYSELTDIARNYIEEAVKIPAMESTTSELIEKLRLASVKKNIPLSPDTVVNLEKVLFQADLVKFAKSKPLEFEIADDRKKIEHTIISINAAIPARSEEEDENIQAELLLQKRLKEKRRRRNRRIATYSGAGIIAVLLLLIFTNQINIFDKHTQKLLEGEWVTSEYGNPGISIQTPEVLTRLDATKVMDKKALAILKEFQMFGYGNLSSDLHIMVSTNKYKEPSELDLNVVVEGSIKDLESKGAQNILVKKEEFTTPAGISGIRAFGTLAVIDGFAKKSTKLYYEMLYFKQAEGLQQVFVAYHEGDKFGAEILEKVIQSVELKIGAE